MASASAKIAKQNLAKIKRRVGRPKGVQDPETISRNKMKEAIDQRVYRISQKLVTAQASVAIGNSILFRIDKEEITGPKGGKSYRPKPAVIVTNEWEIQAYIDGETGAGDPVNDNDPATAYYYITTREPSNQAIDSMLNRAYGRPKESIEHSGEVQFSLKNLAHRRKSILENNFEVIDAKITEDQGNG